ncbi:pyridoxine/pyridoxamine 5'-phosphate oxidase [Ruania halotolerans]|uniref:pyridoxine/pyridoxamine 5'-phosphate oxidase n=1 Tax=Ruania halotolerans TaxID=2897773 RepID=UPI001E562C43|nr:pyridoxal 5'-phosphate synthase [Ruania halotolerans]UFU06090.1 pyridoxal 5'-phosphate synthase [Ruania halotolerans]
MDLRAWLRTLPTFDRDQVAGLDVAAAPEDPAALHLSWIEEAAATGTPAPHAVVLATADGSGVVSARTLILKDISDGDWVIATSAESPKARDLAENPRAALTSFWCALGRQVRVSGAVRDLGDEVGAADYLARPAGSRAAARTGRQSEPLDSIETYDRAYAEALAAVQNHPDQVPGTWRCYAIEARTVEFWAARAEGGQVRLRYTRREDGWEKGLVWP